MNATEKRIAIAKARGWKIEEWGCVTPSRGILFRGTREVLEYLPDYLTDLNAIQEAVLLLPLDKHALYWMHLCSITKGPHLFPSINATARQRADAYLLTLGYKI